MWRETIHIPVPWLPLLLAGSALTGLCLFVAPHGAVLIAVLLLALAWMLFAMQRPLVAFTIVLGVFVLAYARMGLNVFAADGAGGRGAIYFGDLLWLGFAIAWCARRALLNPARRVSPSVPPVVYLLLPYLLLASCLPIFGVMAAGWPVSNAIPGLRQLLWASFAYFAYQFALEYGAARVLRALLGVTVLAGVLHLLYGLLQLGFNLGVLPRSWVALDDLYMLQNQTVLFFYPRLTGLLVNPNSYGLFGAFLFLWAVSLALAKALAGRRILWGVAMACALFALVFSASRSALLGLMVAAVIVGVGALKVPKLARRGMQFIVPMVLLGGVLLIGSWSFLPANIQARFGNFSQVLNQGVQADQGASERVQMWRELWQRYLTECPWGTWVPSSYAMNSAVDSNYLITTVQGTPLFTLAWLLMLAGAALLGWLAYRRAETPVEVAAGLTLMGWAGVMAGGGVTSSPMLQPQLIALFWTLIGTLGALSLRRSHV